MILQPLSKAVVMGVVNLVMMAVRVVSSQLSLLVKAQIVLLLVLQMGKQITHLILKIVLMPLHLVRELEQVPVNNQAMVNKDRIQKDGVLHNQFLTKIHEPSLQIERRCCMIRSKRTEEHCVSTDRKRHLRS